MSKLKAKKHLGQHFLRSESALKKIRDAADLSGDSIVLEIGPGAGALTETLLFFAGKVIAIEKDRDLIPLLKEKFATEIANGKLEIIEKDILDFDPSILSFYEGHSYEVVANIPYYITGAILEKFLSAQHQPQQMVLLVQKEVAKRIVARDKKESILSLSVKAYGKPRIVARVPRGSFAPPPTVDSAILSIEEISREFFKDCNEELFFAVIKTTFGQKRKTIGKTLGDKYGKAALAALQESGIDPKTRPEDINMTGWKKLCLALAQQVV